jgi:hypothetical protein
VKRVLEEWSWPLGLGAAFTLMGLLTWYRKPTYPGEFINSPWTILVAAVGGVALGLAVHFVLRASPLSQDTTERPPDD